MSGPVIGIAKKATTIGNRTVILDFYIENLGTEDLVEVGLTDDLDGVFGAGNYSISTAPFLVDNPKGLVINNSFDGSANTALLETTSSLAVGDIAQIRIILDINIISDQGSGLGVYSNQVTVTAQNAGGTTVNDLSDDGTNPDINGNGDPTEAGENDPTTINILDNPVIGIAKTAQFNGNLLTLDFYLENFGNGSLQNISVIDDLDAVFGVGNYSIHTAPVFIDDPSTLTLNNGFNGNNQQNLITSGTLSTNNTAQIRVVVNVHTITDRGAGMGVYSNQVEATAESLQGKPTTDLSDAGKNPDPDNNGNPTGEGEDNPTLFVFGEEPAIGVAKTASVEQSTVTFNFYLENLGNIALEHISLTENLDQVFGANNYFIETAPTFINDPGNLPLNANFNGSSDTQLFTVAQSKEVDEDGRATNTAIASSSSLAVGASAQLQMVVKVLNISDQGNGEGVYQNQVSVKAQTAKGAIVSDLSDEGMNPDPNGNNNPSEMGEDDPTSITIARISTIGIAKEAKVLNYTGSFATVEIIYYVENLGNTPLSNISITEDLNEVYGSGTFIHTVDPTLVTLVEGSGNFNFNTAFNGSTNTALLSGGSTMNPGTTIIFKIEHLIASITDQGNGGVGIYSNQVTAIATDPNAQPVSDVSHAGTDPDPNGDGNPSENAPTIYNVTKFPVIGIAQDVTVTGRQITFDIYLENLGPVTINNIVLVNNLDAVFGAGNYFISNFSLIDGPSTLILNGSFDGTSDSDNSDLLAAGSSLNSEDIGHIRIEIILDKLVGNIRGDGNFTHQLTVNAQQDNGVIISEISDFGTDPDPNGNGNANEAGENDPTTFEVESDAVVGVAQDVSINVFSTTIDIYIENFGASTSTNISLTEDLDAVFGAGNYTITTAPQLIVDPGTLNLNNDFDGSSDPEIFAPGSILSSGATAQIQLVVLINTIVDQGLGGGKYSSQVAISGIDSKGLRVEDQSDDATNPDPNDNQDPRDEGENDATSIVLSGNPSIGLALQSYVQGALVILDFTVENLGDVPLSSPLLELQLNPIFGAGNFTVTSQPTLIEGASTLIFSTNFSTFAL
jgi:hypothetical protein